MRRRDEDIGDIFVSRFLFYFQFVLPSVSEKLKAMFGNERWVEFRRRFLLFLLLLVFPLLIIGNSWRMIWHPR